MSIQIPITKQELRTMKAMLKQPKDLICVTKTAHVKFLLVAREMLMCGEPVRAKIIEGESCKTS